MDKFGRRYLLRVETPTGIQEIREPLTLKFQVERTIMGSANTCSLQLYNLSETARRAIYHDKFDITNFKSVELLAGYNNNPPLIFKGNVKEAKSYRDGGSTNHITEIQGYDGGFGIVNSFSSFTLQNPTRNEVVDRLMRDLKHVDIGRVTSLPGTYSRGRSLLGATTKLLADETGGLFFIDLNTAHVLGQNECLDGDLLIISSDTGLLGAPRRADTLIQCEILFEPRLIVGQIVELQSITERNFNGIYKVVGVQHRGTISGAEGGKCTTLVSLWLGNSLLSTVSAGGPFAA